jgi:UPF0716 protein FxsA
MFLPVVTALILVPLVELYVILKLGSALGVLPTVGLLLASSVVGAALLRVQGARAWRATRAALAEHRPPQREVTDGALVVLGGALMLVPGFVTDVLGLLLLLPPTRTVARAALLRAAARRAGQVDTARRPDPPPEVIEGEVEEP